MKHRLAALALLTACDSTPDAPPTPAAEAATVPAPPRLSLETSEPEPPPGPAIELPPKRDLQPPAAPATYEDGSRSIRGLREDPALLGVDEGTEVLVRAYVQEIYAPPPCPPGATCPVTRPAHAWLADAPSVAGKRHTMMVTGYEFPIRPFEEKMWRDQPNIVFQVGKAYTIKARFTLTAAAGSSDPRGLLDFIAYKDESGAWVYPPGSPAHPLSIAQAAEQTARLKAIVEKGGRKR